MAVIELEGLKSEEELRVLFALEGFQFPIRVEWENQVRYFSSFKEYYNWQKDPKPWP